MPQVQRLDVKGQLLGLSSHLPSMPSVPDVLSSLPGTLVESMPSFASPKLDWDLLSLHLGNNTNITASAALPSLVPDEDEMSPVTALHTVDARIERLRSNIHLVLANTLFRSSPPSPLSHRQHDKYAQVIK